MADQLLDSCLASPIAKAMMHALDAIDTAHAFGKSHRPEIQATIAEAQARLTQLRTAYPATWTAVRRLRTR